MFVFFFLGMTLLASVINIFLTQKPHSVKNIEEIFLRYLLFFNVGLVGLFAFYGHAFMADQVAISIGWAPGSPFQYEIAIANLVFGILGVLCLWIKDNFWLATGLGFAIFGLGAAVGHIRQALVFQDYAINNVGPVLFLGDIFVPLLIIILIFSYRVIKD